MEEKRRNKNALRSRKLLINAYIELTKELGAEKVSVTKIVERADLNRSTFYAHFSCPDDILLSLENEAIETLLKIMSEVPLGRFLKDPLPLLSEIAAFIDENKEYYELIVSNQRSQSFFYNIKEILVSKLMEDKETLATANNPHIIQANLRFFAGGCMSLLNDWFSGKIDMSPDEITKMTAKTISAGISAFL